MQMLFHLTALLTGSPRTHMQRGKGLLSLNVISTLVMYTIHLLIPPIALALLLSLSHFKCRNNSSSRPLPLHSGACHTIIIHAPLISHAQFFKQKSPLHFPFACLSTSLRDSGDPSLTCLVSQTGQFSCSKLGQFCNRVFSCIF